MYVQYLLQILTVILTACVLINGDPTPRPPQLKSMHVNSHIRNRYARTVVSSKYLNPDIRPQETTFSIVLPDTAFITGFVMEIKDKKFEAYIREKEEAKREYQHAVSQGRSAAHVAVSARDSNQFTVSVNVEPLSKITFNLTYEELLVRKHGEYEVVINLHPGQLVKELNVNVVLNETRNIIALKTPAIRSGNEIRDPQNEPINPYATIKRSTNDNMTMEVLFTPNKDEQKSIMNAFDKRKAKSGLAGQFIVRYDVEQDPQGEILINDGYFVHFFAPTHLQPIPKHVVFVLDVSGSMNGRKIDQLRQAIKSILNELNNGDYFHLVKFHTNVEVWNTTKWQYIEVPEESKLPSAVSVSKENIDKAQQTVEQMTDEGLTNIYDALLVALRLTAKGTPQSEDTKHTPQPIIVFLTDGEANVRESDSKNIIDMVTRENTGPKRATVFTLSFGEDANREFLKELALKNSGFMRLIYEAADASLQLQDFYKQISSPLLTNVNFKYADDQTTSLTKHKFDILFKGSELVVAGHVDNPSEKFVQVEGGTYNGTMDFIPVIRRPEVREEYGSLERLWAYLTIKQLLDKKYEQTMDTNTTDTPEKQALKLSLKYSFVTPVASLVVVKPNSTEALGENENIAEGREYSAIAPSSLPIPRMSYYHSSSRMPTSAVRSIHGIFIPVSLQSNDFDDNGPYITQSLVREPQITTTTTTTEKPMSNSSQQLIVHLPWLSTILTTGDNITIGNRTYLLVNPGNSMAKERTICQVKHLKRIGTCTLLADCKRVYPMIRSVQAYSSFFCSLDNERYAGVCCVNVY